MPMPRPCDTCKRKNEDRTIGVCTICPSRSEYADAVEMGIDRIVLPPDIKKLEAVMKQYEAPFGLVYTVPRNGKKKDNINHPNKEAETRDKFRKLDMGDKCVIGWGIASQAFSIAKTIGIRVSVKQHGRGAVIQRIA